MLEPIETAVGAIGLTLKGLVAGAVGAFISLRFFDGLSAWERWLTFMGGWGIASYGGVPVTEALDLASPKAELFVTLLLGLFGMSIAAAVIRVIRETEWKSFLSRFRGGQ
jgi:hypothetical protein